MQLVGRPCDNWKSNIGFKLDPEEIGNTDQALTAQFSGAFPSSCKGVNFNIVALDANTFLTQGFAAAWELAGGTWAKPPIGKNGSVPLAGRLLLQFAGYQASW